MNYCAVRYPAMYATAAEAYGRNCALTSVDVRPSPLSGTRNIVEVISVLPTALRMSWRNTLSAWM